MYFVTDAASALPSEADWPAVWAAQQDFRAALKAHNAAASLVRLQKDFTSSADSPVNEQYNAHMSLAVGNNAAAYLLVRQHVSMRKSFHSKCTGPTGYPMHVICCPPRNTRSSVRQETWGCTTQSKQQQTAELCNPGPTLLICLVTSLFICEIPFTSIQGKEKERAENDQKRSAERTQDGKQTAETDHKATDSATGGTAEDAAAAVSAGDKNAGTLAAGEPAVAPDVAAEQPKQETANGTAPMDSDAPGDKVSAAVVVGIGIHGRVSADALVQKGCHSPACRVHMMSLLAHSLSRQSEAAPLS